MMYMPEHLVLKTPLCCDLSCVKSNAIPMLLLCWIEVKSLEVSLKPCGGENFNGLIPSDHDGWSEVE